MADRYDPKVTVRPNADRKGSDSHQDTAASDDPLFELARIVSGRGAGAGAAPAGAAPQRARPAPPPEPARPAPPEPDILGDLEAELLSDLQQSFAAVKEAIEPERAEPPPAPRMPPPLPPAAAAPPPPPAYEPPAEPARPPQPEPEPRQPTSPPVHAAPPPQQAAPPRVPAAARLPIQQAPPPRQPAAPAAPPPRERAAPPPPASAAPADPNKVDVGNFTLRPTAPPQVRVTAAPETPLPERPASAAARPSRWDRPAEPPKPQASAASRFAPPRAANQPAQPPASQPAPPPAADEEDIPFGEGLPFALEGEDATDEFPLDAFDLVPGYGDDAEVPPYPDDDELAPLRKRGVPRALAAIAGILALVLIGVLGFILLRPGSSSNGAPPIITADAGPTKIAPPEPPSAGGDQPNKLIYDRVDSGASGGPADTTLVTPGDEQIADVPSTDTDNPIARVILPGGPTTEAPDAAGTADSGDDGAAMAMNDGDTGQSIGPRKVRTVIVRPDGTIVSSDAVPAEGDAPASADAMAAPSDTVDVPDVAPVPTNDDTAAIAGGTGGQELSITPNPDSAAETPAPPAAPEPATTVATPAPTPKPKVVATGGDGGPIDLTPGTGKSANQVASGGGQGAMPLVAGGMMVQVSSQRSQDAAQATFRDLQARYPSILGGYDIDVQRADLGDRGTYYRVRVGPFASANAQSLCNELKNAGGDCILATR